MIPRKLSILLSLGACITFVIAGCGSSETIVPASHESDHVLSYQSNRITVEERRQEWSLTMQAFTGCAEIPCTPEEVQLVFIGRPDQSRYSDNRRLRIEAGGIRLEWPGPQYDEVNYSRSGGVERISVTLSFTDFRDIAVADTVEGQLGPTPWGISYEQRSSLRSIVRQFE